MTKEEDLKKRMESYINQEDNDMLEPLSLDELPEHKTVVEITNNKNENLINNQFLIEIIAPKFCFKNSVTENIFEQKSSIVLVLEHAPNVLKNVFRMSKENFLNFKLKMAVGDEIYSTWEFVEPKIVAANLGTLTKGEINQKRESCIECEIDFEKLIIDGEVLY